MNDCIIISDDEDEVEIIDHIIGLDTPRIIDLTNGDSPMFKSKRREASPPPPSSPPPQPPPPSSQPPPSSSQPPPPSSQPSSTQPFKQSSPSFRQQTPPPSSPQKPPPSRERPPAGAPSTQARKEEAPSPPPPTFSQAWCPKPPPPQARPPAPPPPPSTQAWKEEPATSTQAWHPPAPPPQARPPAPQPTLKTRPPLVQPPSASPRLSTPLKLNRTPQNCIKRPLTDRELMMEKKELGNKHYRCNRLNEAILNYRQASELAKKLEDQEMSAILHFNLAMSYDKLGSYNQAADECAAAVKLNDKYIKAHVKRAEIYMSQRKYDEAIICYEHICDLDSTMKADAMRRIAQARGMAKTVRPRDQYEILGLKPNFVLDDLRAAYKRMARTHHPDKHSDADFVTRRIQEKIFKEASEAYTFFRKRFGS